MATVVQSKLIAVLLVECSGRTLHFRPQGTGVENPVYSTLGHFHRWRGNWREMLRTYHVRGFVNVLIGKDVDEIAGCDRHFSFDWTEHRPARVPDALNHLSLCRHQRSLGDSEKARQPARHSQTHCGDCRLRNRDVRMRMVNSEAAGDGRAEVVGLVRQKQASCRRYCAQVISSRLQHKRLFPARLHSRRQDVRAVSVVGTVWQTQTCSNTSCGCEGMPVVPTSPPSLICSLLFLVLTLIHGRPGKRQSRDYKWLVQM